MSQIRVTDDPTAGTDPVAPPVRQPDPVVPVSTTQPVAPPVKQPTADQTPWSFNAQTPASEVAQHFGFTQPTTATSTGSSGTPTTPSYYNASDPTHSAVWAAYQKKGINPSSADDFNYWVSKINGSGGMNDAGNASYWTNRMAQGQGGVGDYQERPEGGGASGGGGSAYGSNVFSDPATASYEQLINSMIGKLNTPYQAPDFQPAIDQLKAYMSQLNGPAYTPQQMDLMQTQSLDPLSAQRDAARQQIIQHYAAIGQSPSSGTVQQALQQSDQHFERQRTQTQAGFATQAVNTQRQNAQQAAMLAPQIAGLEQQQFSGNEGRQMQGVNLAGIIPALAQSRISAANGMIQPINTGGLLQQLMQGQQTGYQNSANYTDGIVQLLLKIVGGQ